MVPRAPLSLRRKIVYSSIPALIVLVIALIGVEAWLRHRFVGIAQITGATEWTTGSWKGLTYFWDLYHPRLGWTNAPGYVSDSEVPFRVTINSQSLRASRDYAIPKPSGTTRVLMLGDSCTFGEEVDDDATLPDHLEELLVDGIEVLNFGVHGYGLGQMVLRLEDEGFAFEPDQVVIVLLIPLDLTRDPMKEFTHNKPVFGVIDGQLTISNLPVPEASRQPWLFRHCYSAAWFFGRPPALPTPGDDLRELLKITRALLARAKQGCEERGIGFSLALIVNGSTIDAAARDPGLTELVTKIRERVAGDEKIDLVESLVGYHRETAGTQMAPLGHWKSDANAFIARRIGQALSTRDARIRIR